MMIRLTRISAAIACALMTTTVLAADLQSGEIDGLINDSLGRPLSAAKIVVQAQNGQIMATANSDADGRFQFRHLAPGVYALVASKAEYLTGTDIVVLDQQAGKPSHITLASQKALQLHVQTQRLHRSRNEVATAAGSSSYHISNQDIAQMPQGADTPFNQVLLQAPGVVQDSFGQLHVRGDHGDLQYRINGILLPESISGFGQTLDSRFVDSVNLLTGALPAQYGFRTAGVVDIHTQSGQFANGGAVGVMAGDNNTSQLSAELKGHKGNFSYFMDAAALQNSLGIENPMPTRTAIHDASTQNKGFAYFSWTLSDTQRVSAILGTSDNRFQIPDLTGQTPAYVLNGVSSYPSQAINEQQHEITRYGLLALQGTEGANLDYQLSLFSRYSRVLFSPDPTADLMYTGVASRILRSAIDNGVQADSTAHLNPSNTLRSGVFTSWEQVNNDNNLSLFTANSAGTQTSDIPFTQLDSSSKLIRLFGVYTEDEWKASNRLTINAGLRFDQVDAYVTGHQLSPRLGAVYQMTPSTALHAGYAHYYTPPPNELISNQAVMNSVDTTNAQPGGTLNDPVKSESDDYYDMGISHHLNTHLTAGLDAYYKAATNLLDEGQFGSALLYTPFNYAEGKVYGAEFTLDYHKDDLSAYFNLANSTALGKNIVSAQYNFAPGELNYIANNWVHLDHDQTWTASSGVAWPLQRTTWSTDLVYGSGLRSGFANTNHLPDYVQINVSAMHTLNLSQWGKVDLRLAVLNLFDSSYEIRDGTGIGVGAPQYGTRRTVLVSFSKPF